jgi:Domain of unknown function (DUF4390)
LRAIGAQVARRRHTNAAMRSALWIVACLLLSVASWAQQLQRFEIRSAYVERNEGVYQLNATLVFELPEGAREAIREGSPLTLDLDIVLHRSRRLWLDESVASLQQHYEVSFHALSERYLVRNLNSGQQSSYPTLDAALDSLRVISNLPILDQSLLLPDSRHEVSLRAHLDVRTMPDALRFIVFWANDWRQSTEWYTWSPQI